MNRKHLITGGSGYLGTHLATKLVAKGERVVCFDRRRSDELPAEAEFIEGDIRDADALIEAVKGCEIVHHLVGLMPQSRASSAMMREVNVQGTCHALDAAVCVGARRLVFASSGEVYGDPQSVPIPEDHPLRPIGEYGRNKVEAEQLCERYARESEVEVVSLRFSTLVGAGITEPLFSKFLNRAVHGRLLVYPWPANNRFQMTGVHDCVEAFMLAADAPGVNGEAFNIGAPDTLPMREQLIEVRKRAGLRSRILPAPVAFVRTFCRLADRFHLSPLERDHYLLLDRDIVLDCSKAERMLGFRARQSNIDMILEALEWVRERHEAESRAIDEPFSDDGSNRGTL